MSAIPYINKADKNLLWNINDANVIKDSNIIFVIISWHLFYTKTVYS